MKSVKAVQAGIPFVCQLGIKSINGKTCGLEIQAFNRNGSDGNPRYTCASFKNMLSEPESYAFIPMFGALTSVFNDISSELIANFIWMSNTGVEISSEYTTLTFDNEDGEDWKNYLQEIWVDNTNCPSPSAGATRLLIQIGEGRGDTGIENNKIFIEYYIVLN